MRALSGRQTVSVEMKWIAALMLLLTAWPAAAEEVQTRAYAEPAGRVLEQSLFIPAPRAEVWRAWTTSEGFRSFAAPVAAVDMRIGGQIEAAYDPTTRLGDPANIINRVLAYEPERMLAIQIARAPPTFPHAAEARTLWTVIRLDDAEGGSRVAISMLGFRAGPAYDALWRFFEAGNSYTLIKLRDRFVDGPVDWTR